MEHPLTMRISPLIFLEEGIDYAEFKVNTRVEPFKILICCLIISKGHFFMIII
jgi:hypothetical protein